MRKEFKSVKLEEEGLRKLDSLAKATGLTKSQVIMKYLPSAEEAKKDKLNAHFEELKRLLPEREGELDYMRLLLLRSEDLPGELREQYGELITSQLKEFVHLILEMKEGILPKGRTQRENDNKEQLNSNANVAKSNGDTEIIEEEKTSGERYDKDGKRIFNG